MGGCWWRPYLDVQFFPARAQNGVSRLSHSLRNGSYRPGPYRRVMVPKRSGGERPRSTFPVSLIASHSVPWHSFSRRACRNRSSRDSSFAYRPDDPWPRLSRGASLRKQGFTHVVDADITDISKVSGMERLAFRWLDRHFKG